MFDIRHYKTYILTALSICTVSLLLALYSAMMHDMRFFTVLELHKDQTWVGQVKAQYPNLGALVVHFVRPDTREGKFTFTLREEGKKDAVYQATHTLYNIYLLPTFPFGFPPMANSQGKTYRVSIDTPSLRIQRGGTTYELMYPFNRGDLLHGRQLVQFVVGKLVQYGSDIVASGHILFYLAPTLIYLLFVGAYLVMGKYIEESTLFKHIKDLVRPTVVLFACILLADVLLITKPTGDGTIVLLCMVWVLLVVAHRYTSQKSFVGALLFLTLTPLLLVSNMEPVAEKAATWAYILVILGTVQTLIEVYFEESKKFVDFKETTYKTFALVLYIDSGLMTLLRRFQAKLQIKYTKHKFIHDVLMIISKNTILFLFIVFAISILVAMTFQRIMILRDREFKNPRITLLEPTLVYPATKVVIYGDSLGYKADGRYRLMEDGGEVRADYWDDHKIIFTIPLSWPKGLHTIWVEKPIEWNTQTIIEKTKPIQIKVLPVSTTFTPDDTAYLQQEQTWRPETKKINGYN